MAKLTINDIDLRGKRVLTRVDYNVPMREQDGLMIINDDTRILATLPTLKLMINSGAKIILTSHLGRPKGERVPSMSLRPVADKLARLIGQPVDFCDQCIGQAVRDAAAKLEDGGLLLLENVRYHAKEELNDADFAGQLAGDADVFTNDAFGAAHRAHASTAGVADIIAAPHGPLTFVHLLGLFLSTSWNVSTSWATVRARDLTRFPAATEASHISRAHRLSGATPATPAVSSPAIPKVASMDLPGRQRSTASASILLRLFSWASSTPWSGAA